jgi:hypothetical protein
VQRMRQAKRVATSHERREVDLHCLVNKPWDESCRHLRHEGCRVREDLFRHR